LKSVVKAAFRRIATKGNGALPQFKTRMVQQAVVKTKEEPMSIISPDFSVGCEHLVLRMLFCSNISGMATGCMGGK